MVSYMADKPDNLDIATKLVHAGERESTPVGRPVSTPIYASAIFTYESMREMDEVFAGERAGFVYTRYGNPTNTALERAMCQVEDGVFANSYSTGMAAVLACSALQPELWIWFGAIGCLVCFCAGYILSPGKFDELRYRSPERARH